MNLKLIPIEEDIEEKQFPKVIKKYGYRALKFIKKNKDVIDKLIFNLSDDIVWEFPNCKILGRPDFFIWNKKTKEFYFCEFKSKGDRVYSWQLTWAYLNYEFPCALAFVVSRKREKNIFINYYNKFETEELIKHATRNIIMDDYFSKSKNNTMFKMKGAWWGVIPNELKKIFMEKGVY